MNPATIEPSAIKVDETQSLYLISEGHAQQIEMRIREVQEEAFTAHRALTTDEHIRINAMEDVLLLGAYLLRKGDSVSAPMISGVIVTDQEAREHSVQSTPIRIAETPALRAAAALGRMPTANEIAQYERAEAQLQRRANRL